MAEAVKFLQIFIILIFSELILYNYSIIFSFYMNYVRLVTYQNVFISFFLMDVWNDIS
jgi:hypothetical protein